MPERIFILIVLSMVLGVPILGLTARMVIKTLAETFGSRKESIAGSMADERLMRLEDEVDGLRKTVARLEEAEDFRKALNAPAPSDPALPPGSPQE